MTTVTSGASTRRARHKALYLCCRAKLHLECAPDNPQTPDVTALNTPVTAGGVTTGQAAGEQWGGGPTGNHAVVWSYTINSSGTMTSQTPLDLQTSLPVGHRLSDAFEFQRLVVVVFAGPRDQ